VLKSFSIDLGYDKNYHFSKLVYLFDVDILMCVYILLCMFCLSVLSLIFPSVDKVKFSHQIVELFVASFAFAHQNVVTIVSTLVAFFSYIIVINILSLIIWTLICIK
jgi:hypothetical protein